MRKREEIEKQLATKGVHLSYERTEIIVELLLDIRELLLKEGD